MSEGVTGNVPADCHRKIRQICDYWLSIHPSACLPGRQHFDPCAVGPLLPDIFLLNVCPHTADLTYRVMGTGLVTLFRRDYTGRPFEQAYRDGRGSHSYRDITAMLGDRMPHWRKARAHFAEDRDHLILERVVLPLAKNGMTVDIALGMIIAHETVGDQQQAVEAHVDLGEVMSMVSWCDRLREKLTFRI